MNYGSLGVIEELSIKYCGDVVDQSDVLDAILDKCKYLKLACAMEKTRNDWSCGYDLVRIALEQFTVETAIDKEVYDEISEVLEDEEDFLDGRVFRDIAYSYDHIIVNFVDQGLSKDYNLFIQNAKEVV